MKISFTKKKSLDDHIVYVIFDHKSFLKSQEIQKDKKDLINKFLNQEKQKKVLCTRLSSNPQEIVSHLLL